MQVPQIASIMALNLPTYGFGMTPATFSPQNTRALGLQLFCLALLA